MKRTQRMTALLAGCLAFTALGIQPATADWTDCPSNSLCLWDDTSYTDTRKDTTVSDSHMHLPPYIIGFNDKASSVRNNTQYAWVLFDDDTYEDRRYCLKPGLRIYHLGLDQWKFNDKVSSVLKLSTGSCGSYPVF